MLEGLDEGQGVADGGQEHVAARLVGLGLQGEADVVALVDGVLAEDVEGFLEAVERRAEVLGAIDLGTLAATPEDVRLGAQLGGQVEVAHDLAQREAADVAVVGGEGAVLEDRVREQVGGQHRRHQAGLVEGFPEAADVLVPGAVVGAEGDEVIVVEGDAPGAQLGEVVDGLDRVERRARGIAEGIAGLVAHGPEPEAELVGRRWLIVGHRGPPPVPPRGGAPGGYVHRAVAPPRSPRPATGVPSPR